MKKKLLSLTLLLLFIVLRTCVDFYQWEISDTVLYILEVLYVCVVYLLYPYSVFWAPFRKKDFFLGGFCFFTGAFIYKFAAPAGILIPFDMHSIETLFLLLVVAPLLEEFIYRFAFWNQLEEISKNKYFLILSTSSLFSLGHFTAYFFVPVEYRSFIIYQTTYVFFLSLILGNRKSASEAINAPILLHFLFNLGFFLGSI